MSILRKIRFIEELTPVLLKLESQWFPPGLKSEDGLFYGCGYCDMECGGTERHDKDCLSQLAKNTLEEFRKIDQDNSFTKSWKGEDRTDSEIQEMRTFWKVKAALSTMYAFLDHLIPLDYKDPHNKSVICYCFRFDKKITRNSLRHSDDCIMNGLSLALSNLYRPEN